MHFLKRSLLLLAIALIVAGCNPSSLVTTEPLPSPSPAANQAALASPTPINTPTTAGTSSPSETRTAHPTLTASPTVATSQPALTPSITPTSASQLVPASSGRRFRIEQRATGTQDALKPIALVLHTATISGTDLVLRVGFENTSDKGYDLFGGANGQDARLDDAAGGEYHPTGVSSSLRTGIAPQGGWQPGGANVGDLTFPRPNGAATYSLQFPGYPPLAFHLDTPLPDSALITLAAGTYPLTQTLYSTREQLSNIELRMQALQATGDRLIFTVGFANIARQGYDLIVGPKGSDARLLDAEDAQYEPSAVSTSLKDKIAPPGGWQPGQVYTGTISFPKPQAIADLRFTFPEYTALSLHFDRQGLAGAQITSPQGGTAVPKPTAGPEEMAFAQLQQLLNNQAQALQGGDADSYAMSFAGPLQTEQRKIAARIKQVPLVTYTLALAPNATLTGAATGKLDRVPVEVVYTLRGMAADNVFKNELLYSFARVGDQWQVTAVTSSDNPPFWDLDDVIVRPTAHFLIMARPVSQSILPTLEKETEAAYADLQARKLPLEQRYVAYFAGSESDFAQLTGKGASRYLGVALSRYEISGDTITTLSRAFYVNGAAFANSEQQHTTNDRRVTITHELVHLVLARDTRPFTPPWLVEGAAVYYSEGDKPSTRERLLSDPTFTDLSLTKLTAATSLGEHDVIGTTTGYEYAFSGETVAYLVQTFGEDKMLAFYRSYAAVPAAEVRDKMPTFGGSSVIDSAMADFSTKITPGMVQKFFGRDLDQLDHDVKAWLRK
ncbi:MAG: hypothetical protein H0X37_08030 [Herpetosiphonaceae bacterium]|nr:hypothetical protein [Herpetosiphonaceae bacterium]